MVIAYVQPVEFLGLGWFGHGEFLRGYYCNPVVALT